jgi:hypothetical protein
LSDLASDPLVQSGQVNLHGIRFVRLIDIPGDGSFHDSAGRSIYDAWLTYGSGGFDLEAIGVTHGWLGGDANLDGAVDTADLSILAAHWQRSASGFTEGDFDQNGIVDIRDLQTLAMNWHASDASLDAALIGLGLPVPEPTVLPVLVMMGMLVRRRRG